MANPFHITITCHGSYLAAEGNMAIPANVQIRTYVEKGTIMSVDKAWDVWNKLKVGSVP